MGDTDGAAGLTVGAAGLRTGTAEGGAAGLAIPGAAGFAPGAGLTAPGMAGFAGAAGAAGRTTAGEADLLATPGMAGRGGSLASTAPKCSSPAAETSRKRDFMAFSDTLGCNTG